MSLFGGSGSGGGGSLFGNASVNASSASATPNLFSGLGGGSNAASSGPGLFGSAAASSTAPSGGLFGNAAASSAPPAGGLFGNAAAGPSGGGLFSKPAAPAPGSSVFSSPQGQTNASTQSQSQQPHAGQSTQTSSGPAYFQKLLENNKKRARETDQGSKLRDGLGLSFGLDDISKRVRNLGGAAANGHMDGAEDTRAHYMLAASGVNPGRTTRDLHSLQASQAQVTAPAPADWDPDTDRYVEQMQQQMTLKMIADGVARSQRDFDAFLQEHIDMDWEAQRKKIYEHFGLNPKNSGRSLGPGADRGGFGRSSRRDRDANGDGSRRTPMNRSIYKDSSLHKSVIGTPEVGGGKVQAFGESADGQEVRPPMQDDRYKREKQSRFAEKIQKLNDARLEKENYPLLGELLSVESGLRGESASQLIDAYNALIEITGESAEGGVRERAYAQSYLDDAPNSEGRAGVRERILEGSRRALEKQFYARLRSVVERNSREANVGGAPTRIQRVRGYIRVREARRDLAPDGVELRRLENGDYCWALVYFLLRCGFVREAADYVASRGSAFSTVDRTFATYMTSYAHNEERRLSPANQAKINNEYTHRLRSGPESSLDPYRMACVKIIGRCELSKRSLDGLSQGVEDWIWLQFCLAREASRADELATEVFGLIDVQQTIREIGARHFSKGAENTSGFGTFFYLQILGGLFEDAVDYLYNFSYVSAVHIAIGLDYYGLLRVSDFAASETDLLTKTTQEQPQISFSRMIGFYTRDFRAADVIAATDYMVLICLNADLPGELGRAQAAVCHEALRELVLETREFAALLGDMYTDGTRARGAIERRERLLGLPDRPGFLREVTQQAASVADTNGRATDAVLLYHLAEEYNSVMVVANRAMSDNLAVDPGVEPKALEPLRPRPAAPDRQRSGAADALPPGSSLSLAGVDNPFVLGKHFSELYFEHAQYATRVEEMQRFTTVFLLHLWDIRRAYSEKRWEWMIVKLDEYNILPLRAAGSIATIRHGAQQIQSAPPSVGRLVGPILFWALTAISKRRAQVLGPTEGEGVPFDTPARTQLLNQLAQMAKDLMVYAGLLKLRMQKSYWEAIVSAAAEFETY